MSKITDAFVRKDAFVAYLMAGDPDLAKSAEYILAAQEAGADLIEIGIPFSDPVAEAKVVQAASLRALSAGARLDAVFDMVGSLKGKMRVPMVFMTYLNPVFVYGYDQFFAKCVEIGVSGIIIPDLPYEEQEEAKTVARKYGVEVITLLAPTSEERTAVITARAEGFIYLASSLGVAGARRETATDIGEVIRMVKAATPLPVAVGLGDTTPEQAARAIADADGVIVGSAIVEIIGQHGDKAREPLVNYIREMKKAVRKAAG